MNLFMMEIHRSLTRRAVRVLIAVAVFGCLVAGVMAMIGSNDKTLDQLRFEGDGHPAVMTDWWDSGTNDGFLAIGMFLLLMGGLFGGATVAGAEWRAGTVTTLLTWEPRRIRLLAAQLASSALLAFIISALLQVLFLGSFMPAVLLNGTTEGADREFWTALVATMARTSILTALAAVLAVALATLARSTAFAVIAVFAWLMVIEGVIRGLKPGWAPWLWAENLGTVLTWDEMADVKFARGPVGASLTVLVYCAVVVIVAAISFQRRDIAATT